MMMLELIKLFILKFESKFLNVGIINFNVLSLTDYRLRCLSNELTLILSLVRHDMNFI